MGVQSLNYNWRVLKRALTAAYNGRFRRIFPGNIECAYYPFKFDCDTTFSRASRFLRDHHKELGLQEFRSRYGGFVYATDEKYVKDILPKIKKRSK